MANPQQSRVSAVFTWFARHVGRGAAVCKDFGVTADGDFGWHRRTGGRLDTRYAGSDLNWESEAGPLWLNPTISICLQYLMDKSAEPHVRVVYKNADDEITPVVDHPLSALLEKPNTEYDGAALLAGLSLSDSLNGNAYVVKVRGPGGIGFPRELWYIPHWRMVPVPPPDGGPTQFYMMTVPQTNGGEKYRLVPREDVIHIRNGMDPYNPRLGFAPSRAQLRGAVSDNEIDTCTAVILRNKGIYGAILSPAPEGVGTEISPDVAQELKEKFRIAGTGDARGDLAVLDFPVKIDYATRSPQELALEVIGQRPQARLCAMFGIDPAAVGLANMKGEKYGQLRKEARAQSYEGAVLPMLARFARGWTAQLLPDYKALDRGASQTLFVEYDYSKVRDLQENADSIFNRAIAAFKGGIVTLNQAKKIIGEKPEQREEIADKYAFELLPAPGGEFGTPAAPDDEEPPQKPDKPDDSLPDEDDEDESGE